ncbi:MAG: hypothetical protein CMO01_13560 [Thalassobius sp.]|nr:hypothetical protein [Thalassovita sp.]|tara:strand:+ start:250 stop:654 length:405 start_codon:yes stop_codon:yes gene_type:complete
MKLLIEHERADLSFNEDTNTIELVWKKFQNEEVYKMMFTKGIEHLQELGATGWLSDIRKEGVVGPATSTWLQTEIIPKAIAFGLSKIAVVMDKDVFKDFYVKGIEKTVGTCTMKYFDSTEEANKWLKQDLIQVF